MDAFNDSYKSIQMNNYDNEVHYHDYSFENYLKNNNASNNKN
jgi:hypothetical protein